AVRDDLRFLLRASAQGGPAAAGREKRRSPDRHRSRRAPSQKLAPADLRPDQLIDHTIRVALAQLWSPSREVPAAAGAWLSVSLSFTTCMWSAAQLSRTRAPAPGSR